MAKAENEIWHSRPLPDELNEFSTGSMISRIGIRFTEVGDDFITASMSVDHRTLQPFGVLHGGASAVLAETLASMGATHCVDRLRFACVGMEINVNHLRPVLQGTVEGRATPIHLGKRTQVWDVRIDDGDDRLVAVSRLTLAVVEKSRLESGPRS